MVLDNHVKTRDELFVVALDVDLSMVDSMRAWCWTYGLRLEDIPTPSPGEKFDSVPWFIEHGVKDPLEFWKTPTLYDSLGVHPGYISFLYDLVDVISDKYPEKTIKFLAVSSCFPEHQASKKRLIERELRRHTGPIELIDTSAKHYVDFDLLVDDDFCMIQNCVNIGKKVLGVPSPVSSKVEGVHYLPGHYDDAFQRSNKTIVQELLSKIGIF